MSFLQHALALAEQGFWVFPVVANKKKALVEEYQIKNAGCTRDPERIRRWWVCPVTGFERDYNIGISTSFFGDDEALVVVDIDVKDDKNGYDSQILLEINGYDFPRTLSATTPSGGTHLIYRAQCAVGQGVDKLGTGLDIRSQGGYIVAPGSKVDGRSYEFQHVGESRQAISRCPDWIIEKCGTRSSLERDVTPPPSPIDPEMAGERALFYLTHDAPLAVSGSGGNQTTFAVAARLRDLGIEFPEAAHFLMSKNWNDRCSPPWDLEELLGIVENAYNYAKGQVGSAAPEAQFEEYVEPPKKELGHPVLKLNDEFAFVIAGGGHHILWERNDVDGKAKLEHLSETAFHKKFASHTMEHNGRQKPITELWMQHPARRSYDGMCFKPGREVPPEWYNLWRGFAVEPAEEVDKNDPSLRAFLAHILENVCAGDRELYRWLIGYFAHLVQKPGEKPLVALVFRGSKGVGKNALVDCIGRLLGSHYLITSDRRYLTGNFNGHLENCLLLALDEAFWSGDKQAEGALKNLITGHSHNIEHKGKEIYSVDNCTRVVIIGNEDWLVPASHDERRFAVFNVGDGRKQDRAFFHNMRVGMESGGYRQLLAFLKSYDLSKVDVNEAPKTDALLEQKISTLDAFDEWWYQCLLDGEIVGSDLPLEWPSEIPRTLVRDAFYKYGKERNIRTRLPDEARIGKKFAKCAPSIDRSKKVKHGENRVWVYQFSTLEKCRDDWERHIGHKVEWGGFAYERSGNAHSG